jgi:pimeloyl-ACP methyl ester carboxylesterase
MPEAKTERVGAIEMAYHEAGGGPHPFVLVHGFTGSSDDFVDVLPALAERGHTVLVDQRGHGDSTNTGDGYHFDQLVDDLVGFLDARGIARCDLLGHSMGGMVALRFALAHPDRLASLVLMDTSPGPIEVMPKAVRRGVADLGRTQGMGAVYRLMRENMGATSLPAAMQRRIEELGERYWERIEANLEGMDPEAFDALGNALGDHLPVTARLGSIGVPTTIIVGAEDEPFLEPSEAMAIGVADAVLVVVPDAAHSPQVENEEAWLAAIHAHLDRARL